MRDAAFEYHASSHEAMFHQLMLYMNEDIDSWWARHGTLRFAQKRSVDPKIRNALDRMIPAFAAELTKIEVQPDKSAQTYADMLFIEDLKSYLDQHEQADSEASRIETLIYQNRVMGNALSKIVYDWRTKIVTAPAINPFLFAPEPGASDVDFSNAGYLCHTNFHSDWYVSRRYPGAPLAGRSMRSRRGILKDFRGGGGNRVDEMWLLPDYAEMGRIDVSKRTRMVTAHIVNNEPYEAYENVLWYPHYPFAMWRTFVRLDVGQTQSFFGDGYALKMEGQQKLYDHIMREWLYMLGNQATGRVVTTEGTLDVDQILNVHGANIKLKGKNKKIGEDFQFLPPNEMPISVWQTMQTISMLMEEAAPSLQAPFVGQSGANQSGRAISFNQQANFGQFAVQFQGMNEFRMRRTGIRLNCLQQYARRPQAPHMWRRGLDLPEEMPEDARHIGYNLSIPDSTGIPNTILGRLQVLQILNSMGYALSRKRTIDFLKLDTAYGISEEDLLQPAPVGPNGEPMNEGAAMGVPEALSIGG